MAKSLCVQRKDLEGLRVPTSRGYMEFRAPREYRWNRRTSSEWTILIYVPELKARRKWVGAMSVDFDFIDEGGN